MSWIHRFPPILAWLSLSGLVEPLLGQNLSNVASPDVGPADRGAEFRFAYNPDIERYATRMHYQVGLSESWRVRLIASGRGERGEGPDLRYWRGEAQWQFREDEEHGYDSAVRFELQLAVGDNPPHRFRLAWLNKWDLTEQLQFRFAVLAARQFGAKSSDGVQMSARARLGWSLTERAKLAFDLYSGFNELGDFGSFEEQSHQLGPLFQFDLGNGFDLNAGVLFGLTDASAETEYRLHFIYGF